MDFQQFFWDAPRTTYRIWFGTKCLFSIYYIFSYFRQRKDAILNCQSTNSRIIFNLSHHVFKYFLGRITISKFLGYEINKTRAFEYFSYFDIIYHFFVAVSVYSHNLTQSKFRPGGTFSKQVGKMYRPTFPFMQLGSMHL